jgi:O-methyltransferase involved in polyketide biosynthesis
VVNRLEKSRAQRVAPRISVLFSPTSCLIFTYMDKCAIDGSKDFPGARRWRSWVRFSGEPFIFGFDPDTLGETLHSFGFHLRSDESTEETARRYHKLMGRAESGSRAYRVTTAVRAEG